jgi:hypothetical protein
VREPEVGVRITSMTKVGRDADELGEDPRARRDFVVVSHGKLLGFGDGLGMAKRARQVGQVRW